jgi:hypothetical protein
LDLLAYFFKRSNNVMGRVRDEGGSKSGHWIVTGGGRSI